MPSARECCCGCSLRTGTLILLWIGLIHGLLITLTMGGSFVERKDTSFNETLLYVLVAGSYLSIYVAGIYGVTKKKPSLLIPFLGLIMLSLAITIIAMGALAILFILMFVSPSILQVNQKQAAPLTIVVVEVMALIGAAINYHFLAVVLSFYRNLKGEREIPQC